MLRSQKTTCAFVLVSPDSQEGKDDARDESPVPPKVRDGVHGPDDARGGGEDAPVRGSDRDGEDPESARLLERERDVGECAAEEEAGDDNEEEAGDAWGSAENPLARRRRGEEWDGPGEGRLDGEEKGAGGRRGRVDMRCGGVGEPVGQGAGEETRDGIGDADDLNVLAAEGEGAGGGGRGALDLDAEQRLDLLS